MIKQLHFKWMLLLCALMVGTNVAWSESTITLTATNLDLATSYPSSEQTKTIDGINYKYHQLLKNSSNIQAKASEGYILNSTAYSENIKSVAITHSGTARATTIYGSSDGTNWTEIKTGSGSITGDFSAYSFKYFKITRGANAAYWTQIVITLGSSDPSTVASPTFSLASGTYNTTQSVSISCATDGATIYYTTDGSDPDNKSDVYKSPITVTTATTLKAIAYKDGMTASSVASATYTIKPNKPVISAAGATVTITGDDGCTFYYTTDGSDPSSSSTEYTGTFSQPKDCTIKAIAYDTNGNASDVESYEFKYWPLSPKSVNSGYYVKVTDVSDLENGDAILIVNENAGTALGPQSGNNCPEKAVTITDGTINDKGEAQKLILVKKTEKVGDDDTDVFYFYTGSEYLYAASSSKNYLKQQDPATSDARATIVINGDATIQFKGNNTHNLLRYNSTNNIFSCYSTGQDPVQIYKEVVPITITSAGWASFSNANEVKIPAGVTAYYAQKKDGSNVTLKEIAGGYIPANTGVVLSGAADTYSANVTATGATLGVENILYPWLTAGTPSEATYYTLAVSGDKPIFKKSSGGTLAAGKAYLVMPAGSAELTVDFDDENGGDVVTGIDTIEHSTLNIEHSEVYNLNGQRVSQPTKGLYIVNGKKVVVK